MMKVKQVGMALMLMMVTVATFGQSAHKHKRNADLFYDQGEFGEAEEYYRKAGAEKQEAATMYNLGNAIYQQERVEEAVRQFQQAAEMTDDPKLKSQAYYNLGNTYMQAQQFDKGVESYINALKADTEDMDTKKNLTLALQQLQQQQQQQQQQQEEQQDQEQEEQEEQEQQQQQEQQQAEAEDSEQPPQEQQDQQTELSEEEAKELLRIIEAEDQRVQGKLRKADGKKNKPKKDW